MRVLLATKEKTLRVETPKGKSLLGELVPSLEEEEEGGDLKRFFSYFLNFPYFL